jgi:phage baseplate assembly protein W
MADAITNLTTTWVEGTGVQLNWTAADDVTNNSLYEIYVLQNANQMIPTWSLVTTLNPNVVRASGQSNYSLTPPLTSYFYNFTSPIAPISAAFSIYHVDYTGAESDPLNVSVFAPAINPVFGPPHFANNITLDPFGQIAVNPQDSYEEISASVSMVVGALIGERTMLPDFGIQDPMFTNVDSTEIENAINQWEPRANARVSVEYNDQNVASVSVAITSSLGNK